MSVTALRQEQSGTAPPLDCKHGSTPADERAADSCQLALERHSLVGTSHSVVGVTDDARPRTAPPPVSLSMQHGTLSLADVRAAGKQSSTMKVSTRQASTRQASNMQSSNMQAAQSAHASLNPEADAFIMRDSRLVYCGLLRPDLDQDWAAVQAVQAGMDGPHGRTDCRLWGLVPPADNGAAAKKPDQPIPTAKQSSVEPLVSFPFLADDLDTGLIAPAMPLLRASSLKDTVIMIPSGPFMDKVLPAPSQPLLTRETFTAEYFSSLHNLVAAAGIRSDGSTYPALTPNFLGARIKLKHVSLKSDRWRYHLHGYEHVDIVQHIEYGFPLGLDELPELQSCTRNHGSSYAHYKHVDKFISEEIKLGGLAGPFDKVPWWDTIISPIMTAPKKPSSRRTVYDASYGERSLNNATPSDIYLGQPCVYTYPKIDDFRRMVLRCGRGSFLWKRDLARFFLQIPLDPVEYHRVGLIWRGLIFFFIGLAFGLRHSGLQGQKITDALSWIHRRRGLETAQETKFNVVNYSDDLGGCETDLDRAKESFTQLKWLMEDLGLVESSKKAEPPSTQLVYLGVMFDSIAMEMRVPPDKLAEIKSEIGQWVRKTTITRKNLQSLLGKLFWISRVVRLARVFMGRLLQQLRTMSTVGDNVKVKLSEESRKDLKWWGRYLDHFNGVQMIIEEDPFPLELSQMLDKPYEVYAGDATPVGGGGWYGNQYWCRMLPRDLQDTTIGIHLKEFWILIVSARLWGNQWSGKAITLFCDNDAVVDTINYKKPKDSALLSLLREFLYISVSYKFFPVVRKIGTKENFLADHISRRHDITSAEKVFCDAGLLDMMWVDVPDVSFKLTEPW